MIQKKLRRNALFLILPLLAALLSFFVLAGVASSSEFHKHSIAALEEKQTTVLELSAASAAASAAITLIPGDAATPIAGAAGRPELPLSCGALRYLSGKVSADHHRLSRLQNPDPRGLPGLYLECAL